MAKYYYQADENGFVHGELIHHDENLEPPDHPFLKIYGEPMNLLGKYVNLSTWELIDPQPEPEKSGE